MTKKNFVLMLIALIIGIVITAGVDEQRYGQKITELNAQLESSETRYEDLYDYAETLFESYSEYNEKIYNELNDMAEDYAYNLEDAGIGTPYSDNDFDEYTDVMDVYFEMIEPFADLFINKCDFG